METRTCGHCDRPAAHRLSDGFRLCELHYEPVRRAQAKGWRYAPPKEGSGLLGRLDAVAPGAGTGGEGR